MNSDLHAVRKVLGGARALFGAAACSCALISEDGTTLTFVAADVGQATDITGVSIPVNKGIAGWVALSGQPTAIGDVDRDERFARDIAESTAYVPKSLLAVPLVGTDGEVFGIMEVLDASRDGDSRMGGQQGSAAELGVLAVIASQLAVIIEMSAQVKSLSGADSELLALVAAVPADRVGLVRTMVAAASSYDS